MATHLQHSWTLPAAPEAVFKMIIDPTFQRATGEETGATDVDVSITSAGEDTVVRSVRAMSTKGAPAAFTAIAGDELRIAVEQRWGPAAADGARTGTTRIEVQGKPVTFEGPCFLRPDGDGTALHIEGDVRCSMPLIGRKIENAIVPALLKGFTVEEQQGRARLSAG